MNLTKTSKFISLILRHRPEAIGISLDEHGWAKVDELIQGSPNGSLFPWKCWKRLSARTKTAVFFNEDKTLIRANQGHSIPVDVELPEKKPPRILYHGTGEKFVNSIDRQGLLPRGRLYVHLSPDEATAKAVGARHGKPVIYQVLAGEMADQGFTFYQSVNGVWLTKKVPPEFLRKIRSE